ncbi:MAG: DNA ligase III-like protein [uncultured bacterium]|nr:MAG: DNA ligase III-like protein [uncultured bacterium]
MSDFVRFPHTPHIAWLGKGSPRDDKVLAPLEVEALLSGSVIVEEKIDGANLGVSVNQNGVLRLQNRGDYLREPFAGQFKKLSAWIAPRANDLISMLGNTLILFGEWCAARHSVAYDRLPDWFLVFDIYDSSTMRFWSTKRRNELAALLDLPVVTELLRERTTLAALRDLVLNNPSQFRDGMMEGLVIRQESEDWLETRAKLIRPDFTQAIDEHWRRKAIEWNGLANSVRTDDSEPYRKTRFHQKS